MKIKLWKNLVFSIVLVLSAFLSTTVVTADLKDTVLEMYQGLDDSQYVLYLPNGGYVKNADGSADFSLEQIEESEGGIVTTVADAKNRAKEFAIQAEKSGLNNTGSIGTLKNALAPSHAFSVAAGQSVGETVFGGGWQYSRYYYHPATGTGGYLLWTTYGDSGLVDKTPIYPNKPKYVFSDDNRGTYIWGARYKTYNAPAGTRFTVANW